MNRIKKTLLKIKIWWKFKAIPKLKGFDPWYVCLECDDMTITPENYGEYRDYGEYDFHPSFHMGVDHPLCSFHWWLANLTISDENDIYYTREKARKVLEEEFPKRYEEYVKSQTTS